jgi:AcrR family transcriptional regulator
MVDPRASHDDLTARARIRNAALDLYSQYGEERISLRAIAAEAKVSLGVVQHHFKTKAKLREAVDQLVVDHFAQAIAEVQTEGSPGQIGAARDAAVRHMLRDNPTVINYLRRTLLEPSESRLHLLDVIVDLTRREVGALRRSGRASTKRRESAQIARILLQQMGELFLQPMIDAVWDRVAEPDNIKKPRLRITIDE